MALPCWVFSALSLDLSVLHSSVNDTDSAKTSRILFAATASSTRLLSGREHKFSSCDEQFIEIRSHATRRRCVARSAIIKHRSAFWRYKMPATNRLVEAGRLDFKTRVQRFSTMLFTRLSVVPSLFFSAYAATYSLSDNIVGTTFLSEFSHQAIADPTHGRV